MHLSLYYASSGDCIVVPDFLQPSMDALQQYGQLQFAKWFELRDKASSPASAQIAAHLDMHDFAVITNDVAQQMIERNAPAP